MAKKTGFISLLIAAAAAGYAADLYAQQKFTSGSNVYAFWSGTKWYEGKVTGKCGGGVNITFLDGTTKCSTLSNITENKAPSKKDVKVSTPVIAEWTDNNYYSGVVAAIKGNKYDISFDDGDSITVEIDKIRVRPAAEAVRNTAITVRKGGSMWASISPEGEIRVGGSIVGSFDDNGTVRKSGSIVGAIEDDGTIRKDGSIIGEIENDGTLRKSGSLIGSIEKNGTIRKGGSIWGSAVGNSYRDMRAVTALLVFFTEDFGF